MSKLPQKNLELLVDYKPDTPFSRAYQALYTTIALSWEAEKKQQHTVLIATPSAYYEQSIVAANIAIASAQSGTLTILVDADLHTPTLHRYFDVNEPGLSDLFNSQELTPKTLSAYVNQTAIPDLLLLSGGQKQPSIEEIGHFFSTRLTALISSLHQLLQETEHSPGLIIFSCPPVLSDIEALLIGTQVEQTFLVIVAGHTTRTQARKAQEQLQKAHARIEGLVLLNV